MGRCWECCHGRDTQTRPQTLHLCLSDFLLLPLTEPVIWAGEAVLLWQQTRVLSELKDSTKTRLFHFEAGGRENVPAVHLICQCRVWIDQEFLTCGDLLPLMAVGCKEVNPELTSVGPEVMSRKALRLWGGGGKDSIWDTLIWLMQGQCDFWRLSESVFICFLTLWFLYLGYPLRLCSFYLISLPN